MAGITIDILIMGKLDSIFSDAMNHLERVANNEITPCDVMTGFEKLDKQLCGFDNGDLIVVGSRPAVGKTAFIMSCALNNARAGVPVLFYSFDFTQLQFVNRMISMVSEVNCEKIRAGMLAQKEWEDLMTRSKELSELPIYIESDAPRKIEELCNHIEKTVEGCKAKIVYIDYLQLLECKNTNTVENRYQEVSMFSRFLKALARKLNIPIVAASQLNRRPELRQEEALSYKRPTMYDLRDSGTICEDGNMVILLSRPELMNRSGVDAEGNDIRGLVEVIVAKHNNGPTTSVDLYFNERTCAFTDMSPYHTDTGDGFLGGFNGDTLIGDSPDTKPF